MTSSSKLWKHSGMETSLAPTSTTPQFTDFTIISSASFRIERANKPRAWRSCTKESIQISSPSLKSACRLILRSVLRWKSVWTTRFLRTLDASNSRIKWWQAASSVWKLTSWSSTRSNLCWLTTQRSSCRSTSWSTPRRCTSTSSALANKRSSCRLIDKLLRSNSVPNYN